MAEVVLQRLDLPFAWGTNDCAVFAADVVRAVTGEDPLAALRGQWVDLSSAARAIAAAGGLEAGLESMGFERLEPLYAQRGDVVVYRGEAGDLSLAICAGDSLLSPGEAGLQRLSIARGVSAWAK
ncbi:hypothetical protein WAE61_18365 [Comamonadaceae bacterium PP-2]